MSYFGLITTVVVLTVSGVLIWKRWQLFEKPSSEKQNIKTEFFEKILLLTMPILLGFSLFFLQADLVNLFQKKKMEAAVIEELKQIIELLSGIETQDMQTICGPTGVAVNPQIIPSKIIERAASSSLFDQSTTRHLLRLDSMIQSHNRWADFAVDLLKGPNDETVVEKAKIHQQYIVVNKDVLRKSQFLLECITKKTSQYDSDCE